jgi:hypothetical protein
VWVAVFLIHRPAASVIVGDLNFAARYDYLGNNARPSTPASDRRILAMSE